MTVVFVGVFGYCVTNGMVRRLNPSGIRDEMSVNSPAIHISDKPSQIRPCKPRCGSRGS